MNRCLKGQDYGCDFTVTQHAYQQAMNVLVRESPLVCISGFECTCVCICCFSVDMTNMSSLHCVLHQDAAFHRQWKTHTCTHALPPLHPNSPLSAPPIFPARVPMSKPNTTNQQLGMQIVSRDKLCAACQLHTWALGWLSVTCVRVPMYLCRATIMTWCRVSLLCNPTPPLRLPSTTLLPLHPLLYHPPTITQRWDSVSPPEGQKGKNSGFQGIEMDNNVWSSVRLWRLVTEGLQFDQYGILKVCGIIKYQH